MREIKFRAWDKEEKKMYFMPDTMIDGKHSPIEQFWAWICHEVKHDFEVMQFTGLLDKNGKEIYEGDLVGEKEFFVDVTWDRGAYHVGNSQTLIEWLDARSRRGLETEVIGNIYENPNLIDALNTKDK